MYRLLSLQLFDIRHFPSLRPYSVCISPRSLGPSDVRLLRCLHCSHTRYSACSRSGPLALGQLWPSAALVLCPSGSRPLRHSSFFCVSAALALGQFMRSAAVVVGGLWRSVALVLGRSLDRLLRRSLWFSAGLSIGYFGALGWLSSLVRSCRRPLQRSAISGALAL